MKVRLFALLGSGALAGCAAIFGIPSDIDQRAEDGGAHSEAGTRDGGNPSGTDDGGTTPTDSSSPPPPPPPGCDRTKDFGAPVLLAGVSTNESEGTPRLSSDELTIYFSAVRAAGQNGNSRDIYTATRAAIADPFGPAQRLPATVNTKDDELSPNVSDDGLRIFFERGAGLFHQFYVATRPSRTEAFGQATVVSSSGTAVRTPFLRDPGKELWLSDKTGGTQQIRIGIPDDKNVYAVQTAPGLSSQTNDVNPVISVDRLAIYFASDRNGDVPTEQRLDIWVARRSSANVDFPLPARINSVSTETAHEAPGWISTDECRLYLTRTEPATLAEHILVATRPPR